jgi:NAD-dependent dihydropyrimidine dehydrogenase PreA subunit
MAGKKITVVISQSQGKNPAKRHLEEELAAALIMQPDVDVSLVPHLYDLTADHTGMLFLRSVPGDMVVLAWLYPRATRWILDRNGVRGHEGVTLLPSPDDDGEDEEATAESKEPQGIGSVEVPNRKLYCMNLSDHTDPQIYLGEIRRIASEKSVQTVDLMQWIQGKPKAEQLQRYLQPSLPDGPANNASQTNGVNGVNGNGHTNGNGQPPAPTADEEPVKRRWYPVIDYSRCTNCMECIDFCLFGVYGVDKLDRILVEEQDNCKKGCPACSRVCPENAIVFPGHKSPEIAGANGEITELKIDLSKLFGAPSALEVAARERDAELVADGREAVGLTVGIPKRQPAADTKQRDELDDLIDGLDELDF